MQANQDQQTEAIGPTLDQVVAEIQQAEAERSYIATTRELVRSRMAVGASLAMVEATAETIRTAALMVAQGVPAEIVTQALAAATDEGRLVMALLGVDVPAPTTGAR